jgi:hypothetical protein
MTRQGSFRVTRTGNRIENSRGAQPFIRAAGVRWQDGREKAISSTPQACGLIFIIRAGGALLGWIVAKLPGPGLEPVPQIPEVFRADA